MRTFFIYSNGHFYVNFLLERKANLKFNAVFTNLWVDKSITEVMNMKLNPFMSNRMCVSDYGGFQLFMLLLARVCKKLAKKMRFPRKINKV